MKTVTIKIPVPTIRNPLAGMKARRQAAEAERIAAAVKAALDAERQSQG